MNKKAAAKPGAKADRPQDLDSPTCGLSRKQLHELLYYMLLTRQTEERFVILYKQNKLVGSLFRSLGQEGTAVGTAYALEPGDVMCPMIRDLGALYVRGATPREIFCQYMCKALAPGRGKDGIHHVGDLKRGILSTVSTMGTVISVTAGAAWALNMQGKKAVGMTYCGDGGTSTGEFHEGVNVAAVMKIPLVLIIENNGWAYSTPTSKQTLVKDLAVRAQGYGIPGVIVDGNNVLEVYRAAKKAVNYARAGNGAIIIEVKTFRMRGHAEHDDASYVPKEEVERWRQRDPIENYAKFLKSQEMLTDKEHDQIQRKVEADCADGMEFADKAPFPDPKTLLDDVVGDRSIVEFAPWWERE